MKKGILGALPIVAAAYCERFGVPVNIGGDTAYTDGKAVQIPAIEKSYGNMDVVWGYLAHESAHIKWTDFGVQSKSALEHQLVNAMEDCRIEAAMIRTYPGTATTLGALDEFLIAQGSHGVPDETWHPGTTIVITCLYWGMINVVGKKAFEPLIMSAYSALCQGTSANFGFHLISLLQRHLPQAQSTQDIRDLAAAIIQLMQDELQTPQEPATDGQPSEQGQQQPQNGEEGEPGQQQGDPSSQAQAGQGNDGESSQDDGQNSDQGASQGLDSGQDQDNGSGQGQAGEGQTEAQSNLNASQADTGRWQVTSMPSAAAGSDKGQQEESLQPGDSRTPQQAATQARSSADMEAKNWLEQALEAEEDDLPKDRMQHIRQELRMHEDTSAEYRTVRTAPETAFKEWQGKALQRAAARVGTRLQHELMGLVQSKARTDEKAREFGRRLDTPRILRVMSGDPRVFRTPAEKTHPNTAVHLLVDASGSMATASAIAGHSRLDIAQVSALALAKALNAIKGVNPAVSFFGGLTSQPVYFAMRHGQKAVSRAAHFAPSAGGGTPMAEAIWYAAYELSKTREHRKMIMVITDGAPSNKISTRSVIKLAEESGIEVVGIGIETMAAAGMFSRHIVINRVEDLCQRLFRLMGDYLTSDLAA